MTATIEIAPTDTGRSKCIACSFIWHCLACVSLATKATFFPDKQFDNVSDDVGAVLKPLLQKHSIDEGKKDEEGKEG